MEAALYLLPVTLGDTPLGNVLPQYNSEIIAGIRHFIVEDVRSHRRRADGNADGLRSRKHSGERDHRGADQGLTAPFPFSAERRAIDQSNT